MESRNLFLPIVSLFFILSLFSGQGFADHHHNPCLHFRPTKLFVSGDSYVNTGNISPSGSNYPKYPYGITFPGKPDGRFSDGRVLTDYAGQGFADHHHHPRPHFRPTKLFVFGDSYVDTGNISPSGSNSPKYPYGITFPGKPDGRFSDGRVLTDYAAIFLGLKSPIPYTHLKKVGAQGGVNFAYGGSGVIKTGYDVPTMTCQIDFLQSLIANSTFTPHDVNSSFALVAVSGNDYSYYLSTNGSIPGFKHLIKRVVKQITVNLKRIHSFGVKKISITALGPLQCSPDVTVRSDFKLCNSTLAPLVHFHNCLLQRAVEKLNKETNDAPFFILDLYTAFSSIIQNKGDPLGIIKFATPLQPCCIGITPEYDCGSVDHDGNKKYTLCDDPDSAFFWDAVHPTQQGWIAALFTLMLL